MKQVDTREYISMLLELIEQGHEVSLNIAGNSMLPFLAHNRDSVRLRKPDRALKMGDIILYQRQTGQFVLHRICRIAKDGIFTVGDAQQLIEGPLKPEQIFGLVTDATRKNKLTGPGDFWWEFFEHVWLRLIPCRHAIMRLYGICFVPQKGDDHEPAE